MKRVDSNVVSRLDDKIIKEIVGDKLIGREIIIYEEVDSTNLVGKNLGRQENSDGFVVIANSQTMGRGRFSREWSSTCGGDIYLSIVIKPNFTPEKSSMLTILAALSVNKSINKYINDNYNDNILGENIAKIESKIKWPNDITINGKKVCGILTEISCMKDKIEYVVIGIGVNVNREIFHEGIQDTATSIYNEIGQIIDRNSLIADILINMNDYYKRFLLIGNLSNVVEEYNNNLVNYNNKVKVIQKEMDYTGTAIGINNEGGLLVRKDGENDELVTIISGEVSVRGIYGYV